MKDPQTRPHEPPRVDEPRAPEAQRADATRTRPTQFVDPYDMRAEPQPEEPGYGHGV